MKSLLIILFVLLMAAPSHAGLFDNGDDQRIREYQRQIHEERQSSGSWQVVAGLLAIGAVILFTVGTALGSKTRRDGNKR